MSSLGWDGVCPKGIRARSRSLGPNVGFSGRTHLPTTLRAQAAGPSRRRSMMRFYQGQHQFYCGIDLHARSMYLCILDPAGAVVLHQNLPTSPEAFLLAV